MAFIPRVWGNERTEDAAWFTFEAQQKHNQTKRQNKAGFHFCKMKLLTKISSTGSELKVFFFF